MKKTKNVRRFLVSMFAIVVIAVSFIGCDGGIASTGEGTSGVDLGSAANYVILAKSAVSAGPTSAVIGDVGLSPAARTYLTGFSDTLFTDGTYSTSTQVTGKLYAANMASPTLSTLQTAVADMQTAYDFAAGRTEPDHLNLLSGEIGGQTLAPGLYKWTNTVNISSDITISGSATDTWIFQVAGDLNLAAATSMILAGALPENIVWQVSGTVNMGTTSHFEGVVLCKTNVSMLANSTMNGRLFAQTSIALNQTAITQP